MTDTSWKDGPYKLHIDPMAPGKAKWYIADADGERVGSHYSDPAFAEQERVRMNHAHRVMELAGGPSDD